MKEYYIEEFSSKEIYQAFIHYMFINSDSFSVVYFSYHEGEKKKKSVKEIAEALRPYKTYSKNVNEWPGTITFPEEGMRHIYRLTIYKTAPEAEKELYKVSHLYEWHYPKMPMDIAFYKDGYAWFSCCAHEQLYFLYTDDETVIEELDKLGVKSVFSREIDKSKLYYNENAIV